MAFGKQQGQLNVIGLDAATVTTWPLCKHRHRGAMFDRDAPLMGTVQEHSSSCSQDIVIINILTTCGTEELTKDFFLDKD